MNSSSPHFNIMSGIDICSRDNYRRWHDSYFLPDSTSDLLFLFVSSFPLFPLSSCMAENSLGRSKKFIEISGRPRSAEIISQPWSKYMDSYELAWKVQSFPPIQEVRVMYRKLLVRGRHLFIHSLDHSPVLISRPGDTSLDSVNIK